ncbi:MAG: ABC transporter ATP-binding protein [Burkholderiales bacterium]|nr:ABC transporter ATP-binding protein [Burkholderiales bacterium]
MSGAADALRLERVTCAFAGRDGTRYEAVRDASLAVGEHEFVSVVGPTGCGKTTLLNAAAGLLAPTQGRVLVRGEALEGINRSAGYLFQADALMPWKTALDNVAIGLVLRSVPVTQAREQAREWLARVGLRAFADRYPHELSGGMRKRVALAQTLILDPKLLLMDEPFSALDVQTRSLMENELLALWQRDRKSVLFVTHDLEEAIALSDRVIVLSAGPGSRPVAEFAIELERPRDVAEVRLAPEFLDVHRRIWACLREEVTRAHAISVVGA